MDLQLQFSTEDGIGSWLIREWTWWDYSHVDLVLPSGRLLGARLSGGVQIRPPHYKNFSKTLRGTVTLPDEDGRSVIAAAAAQVGKPYDWRAILNFGLHRDWRNTRSWFCSELVAWSFEQGHWPLLNPAVPRERITPRDLALSRRIVFPAGVKRPTR